MVHHKFNNVGLNNLTKKSKRPIPRARFTSRRMLQTLVNHNIMLRLLLKKKKN